ncbi:FA53B protein, partial [Eudromia elegans]|nr:FA53B protein [Eudromia elegans]
ENDRWRDLSRRCPLRMERPSGGRWECRADEGEEAPLWQREAASTCSVTSLIQELSLSEHKGQPSAPPSKRQCRSLSFSDEMSSGRTSWRPLGSKVWTPVEKRRCYSGGSVQRYSDGSATMQRSSSFSLPSRSNTSFEHAGVSGGLGGRPSPGTGAPWGCGEGSRAAVQRSLSCCHEPGAARPPSASSTPELPRRPPALPRSRSQPCVLTDKKVGVKRRRPEELREQRPSLDLAKMTQNRQTFNSLSCLSGAPEDGAHLDTARATARTKAPASRDAAPGRTPACTPVPGPETELRHAQDGGAREPLSAEEADDGDEGGGKEEARAPWRRGGAAGAFQLGGEIDIEQIENN